MRIIYSLGTGDGFMKKIISMSLSLMMTISVLAPCHSVIAQEVQLQNIVSTGNKIAELCADYDDYNTACNDAEIKDRLIVKASGNIDEYGAVDSVYGFGYAFLQYADDKSAEKAKEHYENLGYTVDYDSTVTAYETSSSESETNYDWAYEYVDAKATADYYKLKIKPTVNVAIIDSGINYNHELFKNRVVRTNTNFSPDVIKNNEIDNDGHGTMVAGVVAQSTPDNVKIHAYKVMGENGTGTSSGVIAACEYINQLSSKPDIINFSISVKPNQALEEQINNLIDAGVTVTIASGNEGYEIWRTPERMENAIVVGATDKQGNPSEFSNYGIQADICAPGEWVYTSTMNGRYNMVDGTSFSAPMVAGAAAIVLMEHKGYTPKQVEEELIATATPFKKDGADYMYGVGIVNFSNIISGTRCKDVTANLQGGVYRDDISVELKCANTLVDIYYTTDGTLPTKTNGTKYTEPIEITDTARIIAVAFAKAGTPFHSRYTTLDYYILKNDESGFVIDDNGKVLNFLGSDTDIVIPNSIDGITPTEINKKIFLYNKNITSVVMPDSITKIGESAFRGTNIESVVANGVTKLENLCFEGTKLKKADFPNAINEYYAFNNTPITSVNMPKLENIYSGFENCTDLTSVYIPEVIFLQYEPFKNCISLTQDLVLPKVKGVFQRAFADSYFKSIVLPDCEEGVFQEKCFENAMAEKIVLGKATKCGSDAFYNCKNLKEFYAPMLSNFTTDDFDFCDSLEFVFVPSAKSIKVNPTHDITVYCANHCFYGYINNPSKFSCVIMGPEYMPFLADIDESQYTHKITDYEAIGKGGQIRTSDNGLRFGFEFDNSNISFDYNSFGAEIEYGFVYRYDPLEFTSGDIEYQRNMSLRADQNNVYVKKADKVDIEGDIARFNLVFTDIPTDHLNDKVSVRAYACVDGMYFYSPVVTRSYSDVANAVLNDESVEQGIKDQVILSLNKED